MSSLPAKITGNERKLNNIPLQLLIATMTSAKRDIQFKIIEALNNGKPVPTYWTTRLAEISKIYKHLVGVMAQYLGKEIPREYRDARSISRQLLEKLGITRKGGQLSSINALSAVIEDATRIFKNSAESGLADVNQLFRATQQRLISELTIDNAIASGLVSNNTVRGVKGNLEKVLYDKLITNGRVLTVNTRTGATRSFTPEYYAEVVARTRTREAQTIGTINQSLEYGVDLVQVSSHNTLSDICKPHEGRVYSITGSTPGYAVLSDNNKPGFHPNCWHVITPYIATGLSNPVPPVIQINAS